MLNLSQSYYALHNFIFVSVANSWWASSSSFSIFLMFIILTLVFSFLPWTLTVSSLFMLFTLLIQSLASILEDPSSSYKKISICIFAVIYTLYTLLLGKHVISLSMQVNTTRFCRSIGPLFKSLICKVKNNHKYNILSFAYQHRNNCSRWNFPKWIQIFHFQFPKYCN